MILKNKITDSDSVTIVEKYNEGLGSATIARILGFKTHVVERFIRDQGIMRERKLGAAMALKRIAKLNAGISNKDRIK